MVFQNSIAFVSVHAGLGGGELTVDGEPETGGGYTAGDGYELDAASEPLFGIGTKAWLLGTY